jgi:hypothetical protein
MALALAQGISVAKWARTNKVSKATANRWSRDPNCRTVVESFRRRAVDRAIGRMAQRVTWATDGIAKLAKRAESESVRLAALRSILSDTMAFSEFLGREQRVTNLEDLIPHGFFPGSGGDDRI